MTRSTHNAKKGRKAQISVEFMVVTSIVLLTFMVMSYIIYQKYVDYSDLSLDLRGKEIAKKFAENINQMVIVGDGYTKYISLQTRYPGDEFNITFWRDTPIVLVENRWDWSVPLLTMNVHSCLPEANTTCEKTTITVNSSRRIPTENYNNRIYIGPACSQDTALISEWRFDEGAGTVAQDSWGPNNGALLGSPAWVTSAWVDGNCSKGILFGAASGNVSVPDSASLRPESITVMAWVRPQAAYTGRHPVLMKTSTPSWEDGYGLASDATDNQIHFYVNNYTLIRVNVSVPLNTWTHIAGTYNLSELRIYRNGEFVENEAYSAAINHSKEDLFIGEGMGHEKWNGIIDNVKIYDRALTPEEISSEYNMSI